MDTKLLPTKADPKTDLTGCMLEVIAAVKRLNTNDDDDTPTMPKPDPTSVPIIDCTQAIRDRVIQSPLYLSSSFAITWTLGEMSNGRVLAVGITLDTNNLWTSVFSMQHCTWSAPALVTALEGRGSSVELPALASRADRLVAYIDGKVCMFCVNADGTLESLASVEVPRRVESLAVTSDGELVAAVLEGRSELWLFRYTECCLTLCQTVPAEDKHRMMALAFTPNGTRLAIADGDNAVQVFPVERDHLEPLCAPVARVVVMPSDAHIIGHYAENDKAQQYDKDEPALWISLEDSGTLALGTLHHMAVIKRGTRHFIMDRAYALAALVHEQFYAVLDAAGMVTLRDFQDNVRQVITPEQRGRPSEFSVQVPACCECCAMRSDQMPSALCHPVMSLSADGKTMVIVDQWSVVRVAVASV